MDNIFGIGLPEFVLIVVIAGLVMGPERIARTARSLGALTARLQGVSRAFFRQLNAELDSVDESGEIKSTVEELNQLRRQVADLRNEVFTLASGAATEGRQAIREIKHEAENSILPPDLGLKTKKPGPATIDETSVYRPPLLFDDELAHAPGNEKENGAPSIKQPVKMPKRIDIADDPDM